MKNSKNPTPGRIQHVTYLILMLEIIKKEEALRKHARGTPTMMCVMKILQELQLFFSPAFSVSKVKVRLQDSPS